jgi:hypothetical protein
MQAKAALATRLYFLGIFRLPSSPCILTAAACNAATEKITNFCMIKLASILLRFASLRILFQLFTY